MASAAFTATLSAEDTVLWKLEQDPELRSTVTALALLDRPPDPDRLRRRVELAVGVLPRLRQRVVEPPLVWQHPTWADVPTVDLDYHVRTVAAVADDPGWLLRFAATVAESTFDRARPLWELVVVRDLPGGTAAIVQKVHHSLTDGIGGVEILLAMLDATRNPRRPPQLPHVASGPGADGVAGLGRRVLAVARTAAGGMPVLVRAVADPPRALASAWRTAGSVARILAPSGPRRSPLMVGHGLDPVFRTLDQPMAALRRTASATGTTVNDVFVAAVAGGLQRYHLRHGAAVEEVHLDLPVSFRHPGDPMGGNRFTPVRFALPVAEADPRRRLHEVSDICRRWRHEPALPLTDAMAEVLSRLPAPATVAFMRSLLRGTDVVATNVPGLPQRAYVAGAELRREYAFAPLSGAAVNVSLLSHVATACVGLNMDRQAVHDPDGLADCVAASFAELVELGRQAPAGGGRAGAGQGAR